ncbi:hypothetical protein EV182_000951 [Spiromyces aspiralis]|uniref:Uncharacterized protein n=1 Tax=Spiromyces aspiralis TaxID=68401 RepID=A0ACC1HG63_9FUNG|nr:hypothetical protein EV182_000951 [Spiromyces aspiralis]
MDSTLEEVQKHCGNEIKAYAQCVGANQGDWETKCKDLRLALTKCSEDHVSTLKQIRQRCQLVIDGYRKCLSKNQQNPEACIDDLRGLYNCTQKAAAEIEAEGSKQQKKSK